MAGLQSTEAGLSPWQEKLSPTTALAPERKKGPTVGCRRAILPDSESPHKSPHKSLSVSPCYSEAVEPHGSQGWQEVRRRKQEVTASPAAGEAVHEVRPLPEQDTEEEEEDGQRMSAWG